jgi:hypothetical protein
MRRKTLSAMLIVVSMIAFLALLGCTCQITETDTDTENESATVGTAETVVWLYFPDFSGRPHESIVLMGDDLDEALRYLNGIEFKDANRRPEEPITEMYVAADAVRGYTVTCLVDSIGQVWVYIDEDCLWVGVHQCGANMKGGE